MALISGLFRALAYVCLSAIIPLDSLQPQVQVTEDVHSLAMIGMHTIASVLIMLSD